MGGEMAQTMYKHVNKWIFKKENNCLCVHLPEHPLFLSVVNSGITLRTLIHLELILYMMRIKGLVSGFFMYPAIFPNTICWRCCFPPVCLWLLCKTSDACICVCCFCHHDSVV
jgi:hypothetical protein